MRDKYLFMIKTMILRIIKIFPVELIPNVKPRRKEGKMFDKALHRCIQHANVNVNVTDADLCNFMDFMETMRKVGLYLMENDSFYRNYVKLFFDEIYIQRSESNPNRLLR